MHAVEAEHLQGKSAWVLLWTSRVVLSTVNTTLFRARAVLTSGHHRTLRHRTTAPSPLTGNEQLYSRCVCPDTIASTFVLTP